MIKCNQMIRMEKTEEDLKWENDHGFIIELAKVSDYQVSKRTIPTIYSSWQGIWKKFLILYNDQLHNTHFSGAEESSP